MSAIVCGKRSFFEDLDTAYSNSASPPVSKKLRCFSTSPVRFSPNSPSSVFDKLRALFPNMDRKLLENVLENSGNDLDSAIKSLNELCLGYADGASGSAAQSNTVIDKGTTTATDDNVTLENSSANGSVPKSGAEWVEVFVTEMTSATSIDDARLRAMRVLETLEKSITERALGEAAESVHKEKLIFKEQIEALLRENTILKRAVAIQHERQKEYDERNQEVQQLKQMISQYQERCRTLEVRLTTCLNSKSSNES
ncbi:UBA-like protein [Artemisia annua]|uniref:UBA-like protein n=1 Tax=Artemisia annua TaxID=35608 RepID=A0A2U1KMA8_ARTAN|nr:UBA-like protein [Artemisia annua]